MENDIINIYADDIETAQNLCSSISEEKLRSRAVANVLATKLAERFFKTKTIQADITTGLHNIPKVEESLDISDIYVNGAYVDVRVYFSSDEISVPKFHFDLGIDPAVYMFIKLESDLSSFQVAGFIAPENIDKNNLNDGYYYINENSLLSFYDIESSLKTVEDNFSGSKENLYGFVDGTIDESAITELLSVLISSANARKTLIKAFKANSVFKFISSVPQNTSSYNNIDNNEKQIDTFEAKEITDTDAVISESDLEDIFDGNSEIKPDDLYEQLEYSTEVTPSNNYIEDDSEVQNTNNEEQIDSLFNGEQEGVPVNKKKSILPLLIVPLFIILAGAFAYTKFAQQNGDNSLPVDNLPVASEQANSADSQQSVPKEEAMPNETVNAAPSVPSQTEEASPVEIPTIEQHLDASVLVANLRVDWEVPAGYASNTSAKRYLVKLGKIIQLNLKTELLLLTKPPISNKITVELKYNADKDKFEIVGINDSSGEKSVDEAITNTIKNALSQSMSSNIESFGKLQGNPVLIIHL